MIFLPQIKTRKYTAKSTGTNIRIPVGCLYIAGLLEYLARIYKADLELILFCLFHLNLLTKKDIISS